MIRTRGLLRDRVLSPQFAKQTAENGFLRQPITHENLDLFIVFKGATTRTNSWQKACERYLHRYLEAVNWEVSFMGTLDYLSTVKAAYSSKTYRDITVCIRDFLRFIDIEWAAKIKLPKRIRKLPDVVREEQIHAFLSSVNAIEDLVMRQRLRAYVVLGAVSGMRAHELYDLSHTQIDLNNRAIKLENTKTDVPRYVFFNIEAQRELEKFFAFNPTLPIFPRNTIQRAFVGIRAKTGDLQPKHLRKYFSTTCDKLGMPTGVKKRLMGHSINGDVDLQHYSALTFDDLKAIYDKYWGRIQIGSN